MIEHFGIGSAASKSMRQCIRHALDLTSIEKMIEFEKRLGQPMSSPPRPVTHKRGPLELPGTHIHKVTHEPWFRLFTDDDVNYAADILNQYGLTLSDACIELPSAATSLDVAEAAYGRPTPF
jgi:hypothetical protein